MLFMNEYDIDDNVARWANHPVLGPAVRTLRNLADAANANSDGWAYYPKPARAATQLMRLIQGDGSWESRFGDRDEVTPAQLRRALAPVKSFRTRKGWDFQVESV